MIRVKLASEKNGIEIGDLSLLKAWKNSQNDVLWLDIEGDLDGTDRQLLSELGCHELAVLDAQRKRHPPKVERFENNTFVLFRGITSISGNLELVPQQISFFIGENYLITLHRGASLSINEYWSNEAYSLMLLHPAALAMQIMHYSSGRYLDSILHFEDRLADMEDRILGGNPESAMKELVTYRSRLLKLKRVFSYHEKLAYSLLHEGLSPQIVDHKLELKHAIRDLYDRCERLHSLCAMYYDTCGDLIDGHISISSHQLNHTMRVLTVITAIFIPLGFMAGLYGMNFDNMPELHWEYSYYVLLGTMIATVISLVVFFRHKRWL